jgi:hypothetical protein
MKHELEIISDVISNNNKIVKKDIVYKKVFEMDNAEIEQFISPKGAIINKYCTLIIGDKYYKVNSPYEVVSKLVRPTVVKGFYSKSTRYGKDFNKLQPRKRGV